MWGATRRRWAAVAADVQLCVHVIAGTSPSTTCCAMSTTGQPAEQAPATTYVAQENCNLLPPGVRHPQRIITCGLPKSMHSMFTARHAPRLQAA